MRPTYFLLIPVAVLTGVLTMAVLADGPYGPVRFQEHVIEPSIKGGYSVLVADINHDGKPDVIGLTQQSPELASECPRRPARRPPADRCSRGKSAPGRHPGRRGSLFARM